MGVPGSPFPHIPPSDESSSVPIPSVNESSSTGLNFGMTDKIFRSDSEEKTVEDNTRVYLPKNGKMSLIDFVRVINRNLKQFEQTQEAMEVMDHMMNKKFHRALAMTASSLRKYRSKIQSFMSKWTAIESEVQELTDKLNQQLTSYNEGVGVDKEEIKQLKQAIKNYRDSSHENFGNDEVLKSSVERYSEYVDGTTGRNAQIANINRALEEYNERIGQLNTLIKELNTEAESIGLEEITMLVSKSLIPNLPKMSGDLANLDELRLFEEFIPYEVSLFSGRRVPSVKDVLSMHYDPVHNATIGYVNNLNNVLDVSQEYELFDKLTMKALGSAFIDLLLAKFSVIFYDLVGESVTTEGSIAKAISWATLEKLLARSSIRASMLEARVPLTSVEIDEIQLLILNLLSKSAMQAATGPAFQVLGQDLGKLSLGDNHISIVIAMSFINRLKSLIESEVVSDNIRALIENNPRLASFPESDRGLLIKKLTSIVNLAIMQNGLVQASIALGAPGVVGQVLNLALSEVGISRNLGGGTLNDVIGDRSLTILTEAILVKSLASRGYSNEEATTVVKRAMGHTVDNAPFSDFNEFANHFAIQLRLSGIGDIAFARALSFEAATILQEFSPKAALEEKKLLKGFTLGLIDAQTLLSDSAVSTILSDYDRNTFDSLYKNAINSAFDKGNLRNLLESLISDPLLSDPEKFNAPEVLKEVLVVLFRGLIRQGVSVEDALGIAESTMRYMLKSKGAKAGFLVTPNSLRLAIDGFQQLYEGLGLPKKASEQLSVDTVLAATSAPSELNNIGIVESSSQAINSTLMQKKTITEIAMFDVLNKQFPNQVNAVMELTDVVSGNLNLTDLPSLGISLRTLLSENKSINIESSMAGRLAEEILSSQIKNPKLGDAAEPIEGYSRGTIASALMSHSFSETLLQSELVASGSSKDLATKLANVLAPHLSAFNFEPTNGLVNYLEEIFVKNFYTSNSYANEVMGAIDLYKILDSLPFEKKFAEQLFELKHATDLTESMALASVVTKNAMHVKGAFASTVHLQNALLSNLEGGWGSEANEGLGLISNELLGSVINKSALHEELSQSLIANGEKAERADAMAGIVVNDVLASSESRSAEDAIRSSIRQALVATLEIDALKANEVVESVANNREALSVIDMHSLTNRVADIIADAESILDGQIEKLAQEVVNNQLSIPSALDSKEDFRKAFQDALYVIGVSPETAKGMSESLRVDGLFNLVVMKTAVVNALQNAGFSEEEANKLSTGAAQNLFNIGSNEIDLHMTPEILKRKVIESDAAEEQLTNAILTSPTMKRVISEENIRVDSLKNTIALAVLKTLNKRGVADNESKFRNALRDELEAGNALLSGEIAADIAKEIVISDVVLRQLLANELIVRAEEKFDLTENEKNALVLTADEVYRNPDAFADKNTFLSTLAGVIANNKILSESDAKDLVSSLNVGMVIEGVNPLFTSTASKKLPQFELREQLTNLIVENFKDAIPLGKARRISEEFIITLIGPLTVRAGPVDRSVLDIIKEQVDVLVKQVESKNYRKLILQGVVDTMTSSTQVNFDTYLFTEILNANGKRFLKLIQDALLNNIGVEDRSRDQTIDLLI
ncbi:MAG: hypothetical protein VX777_06930 [Chlamydiota bacterium]|nr:hypothetical protein [Chlamydiota bacterium]